MSNLADRQLERFCQARAVNGGPNAIAAGRDFDAALAYGIGILGHGSATQKAHLAEKIQRFRVEVTARLGELGGPADTLHGGL